MYTVGLSECRVHIPVDVTEAFVSVDRTPPHRADPKIHSIKITQSSFSRDKIITLKIRNKELIWKRPTLQIFKNLQITHLLNKIKWKFKNIFNRMLMKTLHAKTYKT